MIAAMDDDVRRRSRERALAQYVKLLAGRAKVEGVDLDPAGSPLVQ